ncbi:DNA/RNA non-specific endonuclease [Lebetimonas sp. JS085]|uniref:DNA/RNA non-specific endonuclease n=1 Tax=Lebetimonas sp. JS085 TaxID=931222 RepID=UPI000465C853|nr:DNA/RNA non-specific endonuclease [Lebetimonas sp. JS085]
MKKLLLLIPFFLFAFTSKYLPNYNIDIHCDKILHKKAFDICYSCKWKTPILVVYKVDGNLIDAKNLSRKSLRFRPDYNLPTKCRSYSKDYSRTGFDRGHLAPNAVFDYNRAIQKETFLMSNIAPQKPQLNRRLWAKIEKFVRIQARKYKDIRVITGVCGSLGTLGKKRHNVNIPAYWYKIIFRPDGKIISFLVPNSNSVGRDKAKKYLSSVEEIERVCKFRVKENNEFGK